jgi:ABC-2 type transport system ATP-binding protein
MLGDPGVVVLDEPSNGLDPEGVAWVRRLLRTWADDGRTVLVSSHLLAEVAQVVDRVVIVAAGRLITETEVAALAGRRVLVRVDQPSAMIAALAAGGIDHEALGDGALWVTDADPAHVGALAQRAGVTITELSRPSAGDSLEAMFLAATGAAR